MNKLLWFAKRFNSLIPIVLTFLLLCLVTYGIFSDAKLNRTTVNTPSSSEKNIDKTVVLELERQNFRQDDLFILKLVAKKKQSGDYGNESLGTRNLLHINEQTGEATWLFEYQDQIITQQQNLIGPKDKEIGFIVVTKKLTAHNKDQINLESETNVFFVSPDLKNKYEVLKDVDEVITNKQLLNNWSVVYKKDLGIHHALYSLSEHKIISDKVVASLSPVK